MTVRWRKGYPLIIPHPAVPEVRPAVRLTDLSPGLMAQPREPLQLLRLERIRQTD